MSERLQFTLGHDEDIDLYLGKRHPEVVDYHIISESLDARKANLGRLPKVHYVLETIKSGESFSTLEESFPRPRPLKSAPIIIGAGPAGLFCALRFADYGVPTIIIERGDHAHHRMKHIAKFWRYGIFDKDNNVCYGEGGAGLFSDGKLITRVKSPYVKYVMKRFVDFGAPPETAYTSNPHLGSNKIRQLISKMTNYLSEQKHEIMYNTCVSELLYSKDKKQVRGVRLRDGRELFSDHVILATGHSAKEMYYHLKNNKVAMKNKGFAVGVRVEHPRTEINQLQYGPFAKQLGAARYRLSWEDPTTHKGSYSFCMCPGGYVLSSGTEEKGIVVNGMSNYARNSPWSNSALVVSVEPGVDFSEDDVLAGLDYQHAIESKAYEVSLEQASGKEIPAQTISDFLSNSTKQELPKTSCPSGLTRTNLRCILPVSICEHLSNALDKFDIKMKGFVSSRAQLMAPETRTSAPVTILRDKKTLISVSTAGLYPCGEGAGYAGGITSAGVDGVKVAMSILNSVYSLDDN